MTTRTPVGRGALVALLALSSFLLVAPAGAGAATVQAELRVLTPDRVLDPGTTYIVDGSITVPTTPDADCFGPPGGSGAQFTYDEPNALSLLASAARTSRKVRPLGLTDQFGFGLGICGIGGAEAASSGETFWYLKSNHQESSVGADQLVVRNGDQVLFYLSPDLYPNPYPAELELIAPARAEAEETFQAQVIEHACTTDQTTYEITCTSNPAEGVTVTGAAAPTDADGTTSVEADDPGKLKLTAARGTDIPSETLSVCVADEVAECPAARGERVVGSPEGDRIKATAGDDAIRARGGNDKVDLRKGGADRLDCGPGTDTVKIKRGDDDDRLARDCERIRRR